MIYIKVGENLYPASINGSMVDYEWDSRQTKSITLSMTNEATASLLPDNTAWAIVSKDVVQKRDESGATILDDKGVPVMEEIVSEWDNSEYSMSGPIIDHRDGTVTIKMGKPTDLEEAYEMLIGG